MQRWIIHIDMDAFFAAVEQRDNPSLRGRPVVVGGLGSRGVVATASYEARRCGIHSAMPMREAKRLCPQAFFLPGNFRKYREVSAAVARILADFSPLVEFLSLDEAFLDVSGMELLKRTPAEIARQIKERIRNELGLTASAGVAPNKFLAKLASDFEKPDGLVVVRPGEEASFLRDMPIGHLWGVGEVSAGVLRRLGIMTIGQLAAYGEEVLERHLGSAARELVRLARGEDDRPVVAEHRPKSIGRELTLEEDLSDRSAVREYLLALAEKVGYRLRREGLWARTVTVKLRFASFRTITRSLTLPEAICCDEDIFAAADKMWKKVAMPEGIRLVGISVSNLQTAGGQISLFGSENLRREAVAKAVDRLKEKYGEGIVFRGRVP